MHVGLWSYHVTPCRFSKPTLAGVVPRLSVDGVGSRCWGWKVIVLHHSNLRPLRLADSVSLFFEKLEVVGIGFWPPTCNTPTLQREEVCRINENAPQSPQNRFKRVVWTTVKVPTPDELKTRYFKPSVSDGSASILETTYGGLSPPLW